MLLVKMQARPSDATKIRIMDAVALPINVADQMKRWGEMEYIGLRKRN